METTYTIEFMRLAEPPLTPIKQPSAFHVAYYCNLSVPLIDLSGNGQEASFTLFEVLFPGRGPRLLDRKCNQGKKGEEAASEETPPNKRVYPMPATLFDLSGSTALVTGGSKGLGKATARALAEEGASVAISIPHEDELKSAAAEIGRESHAKVVPLAADMTHHGEVKQLAEQAIAALRQGRHRHR
jgi:hypothetical protein